ncbi:hypothetical protein [Halorussus halobius]|uniref:hypothetical protein n=1 Tax=Halorussus halobius TaxID=1710537 RepID=UPI001092720D|nr:hypothetical protein [Halorussus halobius]
MSDTRPVVRLLEALLWQRFRARGWKMFLVPVGFGVFFVGITILTSQSPETLTPSTRAAVERQIELYFTNVENVTGDIFGLALFLLQGPYLLGVFGGILGVRVGQRVASALVDSGQFELLLSAPYGPKDVFLALLGTTMLLTGLHVVVFAAISIGGPLAYLLANDILLTSNVNDLALVGFLLPIPLALWANVVVILNSMGIGGDRLQGAEDVITLLGIIPGVILILTINIWPGVNVLYLSGGALGIAILAVISCLYWVTNNFTVERILPE